MTNKSEVWGIHLVAKTYGQRPSTLLGDFDPWTALQLDRAVCLVGLGIEGAVQEMEKTGSDDNPTWVNKYTTRQLLDPDFRIPLAKDQEMQDDVLELVEGMIYDEVR